MAACFWGRGVKYLAAFAAFFVFCAAGVGAEYAPRSMRQGGGDYRAVLDVYWSRADREGSADKWLQTAREGVSLARATLERRLHEMSADADEAAVALAEFENASEAELAERYAQWLETRFFANLSLAVDENGTLYLDEESSGFLAGLDEASQNYVHGELVNYAYAYYENAAREREAELFLEERYAAAFHHDAERDSNGYHALYGDNSLERGAALIADVEADCARSLESLRVRVEEARIAEGDVALSASSWLSDYTFQFKRGLDAWTKAEEEFFLRRWEWENTAASRFAEGHEKWEAARDELRVKYETWYADAQTLFNEGSAYFEKAEGDLRREIENARKDFMRDANKRIIDVGERMASYSRMYMVAADMVESARRHIAFWEENEKTAKTSADKKTAKQERATWEKLRQTYENKAAEARENLLRDCGAMMSAGELTAILDEGTTLAARDEYQVELLSLAARRDYFKKRMAAAESLSRFARDFASLAIDAATIAAQWEEAKNAFDTAKNDAETAQNALDAAAAHIMEKESEASSVAAELHAHEAESEELAKKYETLLAAYADVAVAGADGMLEVKKREVAVINNALLQTGNTALYYSLLESEYALFLEEQSDAEFKGTAAPLQQVREMLALEVDAENAGDVYAKLGAKKEQLPAWLRTLYNEAEAAAREAERFRSRYEGDKTDAAYTSPLLWETIAQNKLRDAYNMFMGFYDSDGESDGDDSEHGDVDNGNEVVDTSVDTSVDVPVDVSLEPVEIPDYETAHALNMAELRADRDAAAAEWQKKVDEKKALDAEIAKGPVSSAAATKEKKRLRKEVDECKKNIDARNSEYTTLLARYNTAAHKVGEASEKYDALCEQNAALFDALEEKRAVYEDANAKRQWMDTAFLAESGAASWLSPDEEYVFYEERYRRAERALHLMHEMYNKGETRREFQNEAYNAAYHEYESAFGAMMLSDRVSSVLAQKLRNAQAKSDEAAVRYKQDLRNMGLPLMYDEGSQSSADKKEWSLSDIITIGADGLLSFSYIHSDTPTYELSGKNAAQSAAMKKYFEDAALRNGEVHESTQFEAALAKLSAYMNNLGMDAAKYNQWALARDYVISRLQRANGEVTYLAPLYQRSSALANSNAAATVQIIKEPDKVKTVARRNYATIDRYQSNAYNALSAEEKRYLEFYVILTLQGKGGSESGGFKKSSEREEFHLMYEQYRRQVKAIDNFPPHKRIFHNDLRADMKKKRRAMENTRNTLSEALNASQTALSSDLASIANTQAAYKKSCDPLLLLNKKKAEWDTINALLKQMGTVSSGEIAALKTAWETLRTDDTTEYTTIHEALAALSTSLKVKFGASANNVEQVHTQLEEERQRDSAAYHALYNRYVTGDDVSEEELKDAAERAYGRAAPSSFVHLDNMSRGLVSHIEKGLPALKAQPVISRAVAELLIEKSSRMAVDRYQKELAAREIEWENTLSDFAARRASWERTGAALFETAAREWETSDARLVEEWEKWNAAFIAAAEQTDYAWNAAYLAGLRDKERWLNNAEEAVDAASGKALYAMMGDEGERGARSFAARTPFDMVSHVSPNADTLLRETLASSRLLAMDTAFFGNAANHESAGGIRRGLSQAGTADTAMARAQMFTLAHTANEEIAERSAKRVVAAAKNHAEATIARLHEEVKDANKKTRDDIKETFVFEGMWHLSGGRYKKDVLVHSTLIDGAIYETARVDDYRDYVMEETDYFADVGFDTVEADMVSVALGLLTNKVRDTSDKVFGSIEEQRKHDEERNHAASAPGEFGKHVGFRATMKSDLAKAFQEKKMKRSHVLGNRGAGELGRMFTEYYFWMVKEQKGIAAQNNAFWNQPIWDSRGNLLDAPSVKTVATVAVSAAVTIGTAGIGGVAAAAISTGVNLGTTVMTNTIEVATGWKSPEQAMRETGKQLATSAVSVGLGAGFAAIPGVDVLGGLNKKVMDWTTQAITGFATNVVQNVTFENGNLGFNSDGFRDGVMNMAVSMGTQMLGDVVTLGFDKGLVGFVDKMNEKGVRVDGLYTHGATVNRMAGDVVTQGINYAMGRDVTLNLANLNIFNKDHNVGLLEYTINKSGKTAMNVGTGGVDVSARRAVSAIKGLETWGVNAKIALSGQKSAWDERSSMRTLYSKGAYGSAIEAAEFENYISGQTYITYVDDITYVDGDAPTGECERQADGRKEVRINKKQIAQGGAMDMNVVISHEAHRDSIVKSEAEQRTETDLAVIGHTGTSSLVCVTYGEGALKPKFVDEVNILKNGNVKDVVKMLNGYDASGDYFRETDHGIVDDGDGYLRDRYGRYYNTNGKLSIIRPNNPAGDEDRLEGIRKIMKIDPNDVERMAALKESVGDLVKNGFIADSALAKLGIPNLYRTQFAPYLTLNTLKLKAVAEEVISRKELQPGYNGSTHCSEADFEIAKEFVSSDTLYSLSPDGIKNYNANTQMKNLEEMAFRKVTQLEGALLANRGEIVLAGWENQKGSGHVGVLVPYYGRMYPLFGARIAQAGVANGSMFMFDDQSFGKKPKDIKLFHLDNRARIRGNDLP